MPTNEPFDQEPSTAKPLERATVASERAASSAERVAEAARATDEDPGSSDADEAPDPADVADKTDMGAVGDDGQVFGG